MKVACALKRYVCRKCPHNSTTSSASRSFARALRCFGVPADAGSCSLLERYIAGTAVEFGIIMVRSALVVLLPYHADNQRNGGAVSVFNIRIGKLIRRLGTK